MRYVIPDIHGGFRALMQCLELVNFDYDKDELITLGDYFDGHPESIQVIKELLKIKNRVSLMGNHDKWVEDYLLNRMSREDLSCWLENRGKLTKIELDSNPAYKSVILEFLKNCKYYHIDIDNNLFIHAGMDIKKPIEENYPHELIWGRRLSHYLLKSSKYKSYSIKSIKVLEKYNHIFLGHTYCGEKPLKVANIYLMDSGCGFMDGRLTIMNIDTKEYKQSDLLRVLYK